MSSICVVPLVYSIGAMTYQSFESTRQCAIKNFSNELFFLIFFLDEHDGPFFSDYALLDQTKNKNSDKIFFFLMNLHVVPINIVHIYLPNNFALLSYSATRGTFSKTLQMGTILLFRMKLT